MATFKPIGLLVGLAVPVALLLGDRPATGDPLRADSAPAVSQIAWRLTDARVTGRGKAMLVRGGILVTGYTLQSTATSIGDGPFHRGQFELVGTLFSPGATSAAHRGGTWHVNAAWAIADPHLSMEEKDRSPYVASGRLQAVLEFNPMEEPGMIEASLFLTNILPAGGRMIGQGTFSGNQRFEGMLSWKVVEQSGPAVGALSGRDGVPSRFVPGSRAAGAEPQSALRLLREVISARAGSP